MEQMTFTEKRFFQWYRDDVSVCQRARGGSYGGGSEVLIVSADYISDDPTPKVGGRCPYPQSRTEGMHSDLSDGSWDA